MRSSLSSLAQTLRYKKAHTTKAFLLKQMCIHRKQNKNKIKLKINSVVNYIMKLNLTKHLHLFEVFVIA